MLSDRLTITPVAQMEKWAPKMKKPIPFKKSYAYMLLCSEPMGPFVSDLFTGGLMLSMPATRDLKEMMGGQRKPVHAPMLRSRILACCQ